MNATAVELKYQTSSEYHPLYLVAHKVRFAQADQTIAMNEKKGQFGFEQATK